MWVKLSTSIHFVLTVFTRVIHLIFLNEDLLVNGYLIFSWFLIKKGLTLLVVKHTSFALNNLQLQCYKLSFIHPITNKVINIEI